MTGMSRRDICSWRKVVRPSLEPSLAAHTSHTMRTEPLLCSVLSPAALALAAAAPDPCVRHRAR
eukprot:7020023-Prymnesium_polylepis.1